MWTMIVIGVALAGSSLAQYQATRQQINRVEDRLEMKIDSIVKEISALRERMAKLEGLLEGLRGAISARRATEHS